jgi:excisionase family DNA binding protein
MGTHSEEARQASFRWTPAKPKPLEQMFTLEEASQAKRIAPATLRKYVADGILPAYRAGTSKQLRFKESDLDALFSRVVPKNAVLEDDAEQVEEDVSEPALR